MADDIDIIRPDEETAKTYIWQGMVVDRATWLAGMRAEGLIAEESD